MAIILTRPQPNIVMPDGAWMGRTANGPKVEFDDTNNYLEITGCKVGIGMTAPSVALHIKNNANIEHSIYVENQTAGTGAGESLYLVNDISTFNNSAQVTHFNTGYTTNGLLVANRIWFTGTGGEVMLGTRDAKDLIFHTGGVAAANERMRVLSNGNVGIGTTDPQNLVHAVTNPATTNTVIDVLRLDRITSGTAADGIGCGIVLYAEDASANIEEAANIDAVFTTATHATQVGELRLGVMGTNVVAIDSKKNVVLAPAAIATDATDGFTYIPTCAGAPTGVPTAKTGTVALMFDTSNNKLYVYDGGWLNVTLAA